MQIKRQSIDKTQKKSHLLKNQLKDHENVVKYFNNNYLQNQLNLSFKDLNLRVLEKQKEYINKVNSSSII